ncbi:hypothetical protein ASZ78_008416 [Callipepla squamata]|uniref:USP domain-containing protein n=1 Tax=Callipepla squamata TaxID=9009 RepID=A0A226MRX8_CALSU|nr:hypothetical protein ASZ78_008416 [Callipepla squamata]
MDTQKTTNGLRVIGQGTGIGKSTLHMVGYLGKSHTPVEEASPDYCPVCKEKGQVQVLRTYRINFQESIYLCENPQCIYPLGYKPFNSIIISADSENLQVPSNDKKRKLCDTSDLSPIESNPKQARTNLVVSVEQPINTGPVVKNSCNSFCIPQSSVCDVLQNGQQKSNNEESINQKVDFETTTNTNGHQESPNFSSRTQLLSNSSHSSTTAEILLGDNNCSTNNTDLCLQWRNKYNLCWLDCVLSALVHLEALKSAEGDEKCLLQRLLAKYNQASVLLNTCKRSKVKGECIQLSHIQIDLVQIFGIPYNVLKYASSLFQDHIQIRVPSVLMLHFVEGLPHNNLKSYSFQFEEDIYQITSVIQYKMQKKHFITWSLNPDGTWLECDDLKGPYCRRRKRFEVPPTEIHIVIWEKKASHLPQEQNSQCRNKSVEDSTVNNVQLNSTVLHCGFDNALDKILAEDHKDDSLRIPDKKQQRVAEGESSVRCGLENLVGDDLVTQMLEETPCDSESKSLPNGQMVENNLVVEVGSQEKQESAFSPNAPYTGEFTGLTGTDLAMNDKGTLSENASICLSLQELNPPSITPPVPKKHGPNPSDSLLAQSMDGRANLHNGEHGSGQQITCKLPPVERTVQKSPDLKGASKIAVHSQLASSSADNNSSQPSDKDQKRGFVGSWVKKLLSKNTSFLPSSALIPKSERSCKTPSVQKSSDTWLPVKGASNFGGFQGRGECKTSQTLTSALPRSNNAHGLSHFKGFSPGACLPQNHSAMEGPAWNKSGNTLRTSAKTTQVHSPSHNSATAEESDSDKTRKLRLKLLKKLNAKKKKLASLDRLAMEQAKHGKPVAGDVSPPSQAESRNDSELLQSFLRELQYHIDAADHSSELSVSSGCTSHNSNDEILAELLSPASTVASSEVPKSEDECMYMEMVNSSSAAAPEPAEKTCVSHANTTSGDRSYYSPVKDGNYEHTVGKSSVKRFGFESPTREDIFEDLFSVSAPATMAGDIDVPHFDETLFETW